MSADRPTQPLTSDWNNDEPFISWVGVSLVFVTPALGGFLYGYDIGATSFVLSSMLLHSSKQQHGHLWWDDLEQRQVQQGLLISMVALGALLSSHVLMAHVPSNALSRRMELRLSAALYGIGSVLNILSGTWFRTIEIGLWLLLLGRLVTGLGVGIAMHGAPTYLAEMAPTSIRGALVSAKEPVICGGIVLGYTVGAAIASSHGWTNVYVVSLLLSLPMLFLTWVIPRSKRWLLLHGLRQEAKASMEFIYSGDVDQAFEELANTIQLQQQDSSHPEGTEESEGTISSLKRLLLSPSLRPSLTIAMGLIAFQQLSGQPSFLSYATVLLKDAGWSGDATIVAAMIMLVTSSTTVFLVDRFGRRRLLQLCIATMMLALVSLSVLCWGLDNRDGKGLQQSSFRDRFLLIAVVVYIGGYQLGFGPIGWLVVVEVLPLRIRGPATALAVELNYLLNFAVQFLLPLAVATVGWGATFAIFALFMVWALVFVTKRITETMGRTLEEIEDDFAAQSRQAEGSTIVTSRTQEESPLLQGSEEART